MSDRLTRLIDILNYSTELLKSKGISDPRLNSELLMADALNCSRLKLYLDYDKPLLEAEKDKFKSNLRKRLNYVPIQYIIGYTEFYGYRIKIKEGVFIPRPDTEILVDKLLNDIYENEKRGCRIFEIGCGSGCITVSVLSELKKKNITCKYFACDINKKALELTGENLLYNNITHDYVLKECDFLSEEIVFDDFDYIISNPPYISLDDFINLDNEIKYYEPQNSLTDYNDGILFLSKIVNIKINNKLDSKVFIEIGDGQKELIKQLFKTINIVDYTFYKDLKGIDRLIFLK